ncbi:hypothetical protein BTM142_03290 [Helicobacter pylori]
MIVFYEAILGAIKGNGFKTFPILYEFCYQTKFKKKQFFKSERMAKNLKLNGRKLEG